jgi:type I restriction-modification system DNA methylase subunit/restriction endonuclease S subunit
MSKEYSCELCKKIFNQKIDYTRHKKTPCITLTEIEQINKTTDNKTTLINVFKNCLNILRDNEGLTGEKALRNMSYLLILKLIEHHIGNEIDIDNYEYDFSHIEDKYIDNHKNKLLEFVRFSNIIKENEDNIPNKMKYLWDDILSKHPSTKNIFLKDKSFDIKHKSTYKKIIDKLNTLPNTEYDILGNAYEEVIQDIMTGKVLGQFFTQPLVKKMMVKLIDPQIHSDGKIDTCGDPTMGTGGFLITYLKYILQQATTKNIKPNWDFIKTEGLYGKELEPDTYQLAISNMLISSGHMFEQLERGDSIRDPITRKFDNILANPPFGIKGLKYDDFNSSLKFEYTPIKTDNAVSLFIQAIIYMLKINGKCAVVLPDGQDLFSKSNKTLVSIREYLMKTCDLKEIIYLPSGIFTYTTIKTCVFYFIKKKEGKDVLETKIKMSKTQKETGRDYKFSKTHQTTNVKFYNYNPYEDVKNLLVEIPIEKIANNSYSLNYTEYIKEENEEEKYVDSIIVKTLGEVCEFLPKSKRNAKYGNREGLYPFFKSSTKVDSYVDEADYEEESLIIGDGGEPNINYGIKFSTSDHCYILQNKNKSLLNLKYSYYYLYHNLDMMKQLYTGVAIKNISKTNIEGIKIPIPSLERQQEIVKYLDFIYEKTNKTSLEKIQELKMLNELCLNNQKMYGDNEIKTLEEVCTNIKTGKNKTSDDKKGTLYPYYGTGGITGYTNDFLVDDNYILVARNGTIGQILLLSGKSFPSDHMFIIKDTTENIKYLYFAIKYLGNLTNYAHGATIQGITKENLNSIKIPIPSLEQQQKIVDYLDFNNNLIDNLNKEIENNKKQAQLFITGIVKAKVQDNNELVDEDKEEDQQENIIEPKTKVEKLTNNGKKPLVENNTD